MNLPIYYMQFFLKNYRINAEGKAPIYLRIRINKSKMELSTSQYIYPKFWDNKRKQVAKTNDADQINMLLNNMRSNINQAITQVYITTQRVTLDDIKKALNGESLEKERTLLQVTTEHNLNFEKLIGIKYSWGSYKNYKTTLSFLKEFIPYQYKKPDLLLPEVNNNFCQNLFMWLTTIKKTSNQNGANKHIQRLKKIINYAYTNGYIDKSPIRNYPLSFKIPARVSLTWEEVKVVQDLKLSTETLYHVRNVFIFMVWTGLSYSDVKVFSRKHIYTGLDGKPWLKMERTKTRNTFTVPLLKPALQLLNEYINKTALDETPIFPVLSNQKMNSNLKIIQEIAGIGKKLHSHLPRHTFASTITLQSGIPLETVSKMLGHSKINITQVYARVGEVKIAEEMKGLDKKLRSEGRF
jgi:site-specific recombinase XerD